MKDGLRLLLDRQQYRVHGSHSAVKLCHWMGQSLLRGRHCYKQEFYGISTHRCLQMTPAVDLCNHRCLFCWRVQGFEADRGDWDDPGEMLDALISHQRNLISGFKGDPRCPPEKWEEAVSPRHVAISLAGEPTLYPHLGDFIEVCHRRGMTTFLVTNGTEPDALTSLNPLPTQLYVTVAAPNREVYRRTCAPLIPDGWERLMSTLDLLPSLDTRTVIRHTLVKDLNMGWEEEYADLVRRADPTFIEPKGYVFVGGSRTRLSLSNMPAHAEVREFGERIGERLSLEILKERGDSRVVLLGERGADTEIPGLEGE